MPDMPANPQPSPSLVSLEALIERLEALIVELDTAGKVWGQEAHDMDQDGDFCCALTRRHDAGWLFEWTKQLREAAAALRPSLVRKIEEKAESSPGTPGQEESNAMRLQHQRANISEAESAAILKMWEAHEELRRLGWREAIYCPKDGTAFWSLEPGSTGIHDTRYEGEWPKGHWWVAESNDLWPSRPCLFKEKR